jgi:hypothetical protein
MRETPEDAALELNEHRFLESQLLINALVHRIASQIADGSYRTATD